jgi:predicted RNA-binding Zn ribbon-like protein
MQPLAEIPFVAGDIALDFVNTAEERGHPDAGDALRDPADLAFWGRRYGLLSSAAGDGDRAELRRAIEARELLYRLCLAHVHARPAVADDLERLAALAAAAYRAGTLEPAPDGQLRWHWSPAEPATVRHAAVAAAVRLFGSDAPDRLKQCPGDHCGWFFLDSTKRGNRRWCSMSECGQEAKTARRRQRAHSQPDDGARRPS